MLIMIGESTYEMASDKIEARKLGLLGAKENSGWRHELLAKKGELDAEKAKLVQQFERLGDLCQGAPTRPRRRSRCVSRSWTTSRRIYVAQCEQFIENPLPGWARGSS